MIVLKNICKKYDDVEILNNVNYKFESGKIYVIKGVSGSGKSTLLNILSGIDLDFSGEYLYNGKIIKDIRRVTNIGYIMQHNMLVLKLKIIDNLRMIKNDIVTIEYYAKLFDINHILNKYPSEISGGERQRVSIIRALLSSDEIILADEPTSSLDIDNAKKIVQEFKKLKNLNKIVIIATHDDCFDIVADEIIQLDYGIVKKGNCNSHDIHEEKNILESLPIQSNQNHFKSIDKKYVKLRLQQKSTKRFIMIFSLLFCIFLMLFGFKDNFKLQYSKKIKNYYPINTFYVDESVYEDVKNLSEFEIYENYNYIASDGIKILTLPNNEDSIFKNKDYLLYGKFPSKDNEVLVNDLFCKKEYNGEKINDCINKKIDIDNMTFIISGIITNDSDKLSIIVSSNPHYSDILNSSELVFSMYNNIEKYGTIEKDGYILLSSNDLYNNKSLITTLKSFGVYLYWDNYVETYASTLDFVFNIFLLVILFVGIIAFLFVNNEISFQLYLRKKEIGIFQIFNISKKRIMKNILLEYYIKFLKVFIYGILLNFVFSCIIFIVTDFYIIPKTITLCIVCIIFLVYSFLILFYPVRKFLKKKIIKLLY